ncbi:MAG: S-layer homology domain-containing protein, partial [Oscillospiraceae bacterium]|nr:S-layer homology domain-containing protein [Oscillospiraceae bacterium]
TANGGIHDAPTANLSGYTDTDEISDWASEAMRWANAAGLITGRTETTLAPKGTASRAEAATLLQRYMQNVG